MISRRNLVKYSLVGAAMAPLTGLRTPAFAAGKVLVSEAVRLGMYASLYVAADKGLLARHGLDAEVSTAGGIALPVPILLSGRGQIGVTSPGMSVNAVREGGRIKNIAKIVGGVSMWGMARPDSKIRTIDDLRGKTIATLKFPSSTIQVPTFAMKTVGKFDPAEAGVKFLELPAGAQAAAVKDGRADIATAFEWDISIGAEQFGLVPVLSFADVLGPVCFTTAMATDDVIASNPTAIQGFCNAIAEAQKMMHQDNAVFTEVAEKYFPKVSPSVVANATRNFFGTRTAIPRNPTISEAEWDRAMELEQGGGAIKSTLPYTQMVDNRFADNATRQFGLAS
ncbi:ABC transporter substrate-binding protein [Bradyrhizobium sp. U87765 SZCCT0131]|uniref:ABC transporter substrate-binding protein n=1 Tax=unclassified Bradyrhizobium TaxID=2631580 RepID=UPI001BAB5862|nr:ABC transporter substrate-binding protein [Bradyrhizobium sp. U87765 SZCCT0131]MBR1264081.1 ABC transporter substrate-binding protein [Bradyrhizobium sp. U87765 SZCCT0134]MBR1308136.1 ABC transporter substrate-binding protein [Bradyrhizobium sp. U87765 SZCCT0110]MBR1320331.1 ABC transporter substrate-binding protein [Bradyrhizobium sp. U87765 SZCCT0109]MBR1348556.1 ABC transporter substrate-binding protein [Bradyrhizobium sp. U87765 SZCCT0048]